MSLSKILVVFVFLLFATIAILALFKKGKDQTQIEVSEIKITEIPIDEAAPSVENPNQESLLPAVDSTLALLEKESRESKQENSQENKLAVIDAATDTSGLPDVDRIEEFFNKGDPKFPFVETIVYKSRVPWQKGRPAWLSDYAAHYETSRHFIARSLNGGPNYFKQDIAEGDRFNVLSLDKKINFYLLIDISRSKMWFYAWDLDSNERTLIKTYRVGLGRLDSAKKSGSLTPLGKYSLGEKIAIYTPKSTGFHNGEKVGMITVFGTRWIPFDKEIKDCTAPAKGFGIHGVPWHYVASEGRFVEDKASIGKYESDGCVRLDTGDMEELFAIVITKPTVVELVQDFRQAGLPGKQ
jgi:hypothetical protein